nr:hypothetical protein GCM10020092_051950 [Actinoplanes digitatis]
MLLGSVSQRVATHAACPVVVVRGRGDAAEGPVVAGVDDSPAADGVLETAFDAAARRGSGLSVVRSYLPVIPLWLAADVRPADVDMPETDAEERARLDEQLAPWRAKHPEVPVEVLLTHEGAAAALVKASAGAQLVVVGSHGHGGITGTLLGSAEPAVAAPRRVPGVRHPSAYPHAEVGKPRHERQRQPCHARRSPRGPRVGRAGVSARAVGVQHPAVEVAHHRRYRRALF